MMLPGGHGETALLENGQPGAVQLDSRGRILEQTTEPGRSCRNATGSGTAGGNLDVRTETRSRTCYVGTACCAYRSLL